MFKALVVLVLASVSQYSLAVENCPARGTHTAVDLSTPVTQKFLNKMAQIGVKTIIRYYDYYPRGGDRRPWETLNKKTLHKAERDLIINNGFKIGVVFQHNNNSLASFTSTRGRADAERSLALAEENRQPRGTAIYFGVDGGWGSKKTDMDKVRRYFREAKVRIQNAGYKIGVYGSGLVCKTLLSEGLAELCWLAAPSGWPGSREYLRSGQWSLRQKLPLDCGGINVDFNVVNSAEPDFGQFGR